MALLEVLEGILVVLDRRLELLDVLCSSFSKCSLGLSVRLLTFLRSSVDLLPCQSWR